MRYCEAEIKRRIAGRRRDFLVKIIAWALLDAAALTAAAIFPETTTVFVCTLTVIISAVFITKTVRRYHPKTLFSGEIKGINIKEHEFVKSNLRPTFSARLIMPKAKTSGFAAQRTRTKAPTSAIVYLKLENGDVTYIEHLTNAQTDIYEIGDTLYKYPGTRYPIIIGKESKTLPCPLCGTANKHIEERCLTCGLKIEN